MFTIGIVDIILYKGDLLLVKNFQPSHKQWLPGVIIELLGPVSACVKLSNYEFHGRHYDLRNSYIDTDDDNCKGCDSNDWFLYPISNDARTPLLIGPSQYDSPI